MSNQEKILRSIELLKEIGYRTDSICAIKHLPAQEGRYREYPDGVHPALREALGQKGFHRLYSHQRSCWDALREKKNVVVVTPTASGKTLCYNLPVLDAILKDPSSRALCASSAAIRTSGRFRTSSTSAARAWWCTRPTTATGTAASRTR